MHFVFDDAALENEDVRRLASLLHTGGQVIHWAGAVGSPPQNPLTYATGAPVLYVSQESLIKSLRGLNVNAFWTANLDCAQAAREAGLSTCWVGNDPFNITSRRIADDTSEFLQWGLRMETPK